MGLLGTLYVIPCVYILAAFAVPAVAKLKTAEIGSLYRYGLGAGVLGIGLLFAARLPLYRQGWLLAFGPRQLDRWHRRIYWLAYAFVTVSLLLLSIVCLRTG